MCIAFIGCAIYYNMAVIYKIISIIKKYIIRMMHRGPGGPGGSGPGGPGGSGSGGPGGPGQGPGGPGGPGP